MRQNNDSITGMRYLHVSLILTLILIIFACKKDDYRPFENEEYSAAEPEVKSGINVIGSSPVVNMNACGTETTVDLIAGQIIDIGSIEIANTQDSLYITITAEGSWWISAAHVYVGSLNDIPLTSNGNPRVGNFPYQDAFNPLTKTTQFRVPLNGLPPCYIVAVHIEAKKKVNGQIVQTETGWGQGAGLPGPNWAMYITYCTQECQPCLFGSLNTPLYTSQNVNVGEVHITNNEDSVFVTVDLIPTWYFRKIYVYAGPLAGMPNTSQYIPLIDQFPIRIPLGSTLQTVTVGYPIANFPPCYVLAVHADVLNTVNGVFVQAEKAWGYGTPFTNTTQWGWTIPYCTKVCE